MKLQNRHEAAPSIPDDVALWDKNTVKQVMNWKADSALYNAIKRYDFPPPVRIGNRKSMWRKCRVLDWMRNLEEGMDKTNEASEVAQ